MASRSILHIRIDSFAAVVEQGRRPELRGKAVIVACVRGNGSGVVVSASREARKLGVEDGMGLRQARRSCPDGVVLVEDKGTYIQVFNSLLDILAQYSPLLEPDLPGSAYLDVTGSYNLFGDADKIANRILNEVRRTLGLRVSIGCASSKLLARAASGTKQGAVVKLCIGFEEKFISNLPVSVLDSVSGKVARRLGELGVSTVGQLAMIPERLLVRQFGPVGALIRRQSLGIDPSQVRAAYPPDVIISEHMFGTAAEEPEEVMEQLRFMAEDAAARLRKQGKLAGEILLELFIEPESHLNCEIAKEAKSRGSELAAYHFKKPTDYAGSIAQVLERLLQSKMRPGMEIAKTRLILCNLTVGSSAQLCLIGDGERRQRLERAVEILRTRFGERSVRMAGSLV